MTSWPIWAGFLLLVMILLALDLGVLNRKPHVISAAEALGWTAFWVALALLFNAAIYLIYEHHWLGIGLDIGHPLGGTQAALEFFTAYLVEKSLSLDNIFVIAMIFAHFGVPAQFQHRVLFWGILGALVLRGVMIGVGLAIMGLFSWVVYVFGALLLFTAAKMLVTRHDNLPVEHNSIVRLVRRWFPITEGYHEQRFMVLEGGKLMATPLFLALVLVESTDVLFAVDSIPAVFAVTRDPFIVFSSNVFAILGLRSLYFALAAIIPRFRYLKMSLVFLLAFIGIKMILSHHHPIPTFASLAMIGGILTVGILASVLGGKADPASLESPLAKEQTSIAAATYKGIRRLFVLLAGATLLLIGAALLVLPGPGVLTIIAGLAVLATEFVWARVWMLQVKDRASRMSASAKRLMGKKGDTANNE